MRILFVTMLASACASPTPGASEPEETSGSEEATVEIGLSDAPPEAPPANTAFECTRVDFMTVTVPPQAYDSRNGSNAARFSQLVTSQEKPMEGCGLDEVLMMLTTLQCDDGTNPFQGNRGAAHRSRAGNTGAGGRCGSIIDLYRAPCPEGTYEVFADMYFCPAR